MPCSCFVCRYFQDFRTKQHRFSIPFRHLFRFVWFVPMEWLASRNYREGESFFIMGSDGKAKRNVHPWHGLVIEFEEGAEIPLAWWKLVKRAE